MVFSLSGYPCLGVSVFEQRIELATTIKAFAVCAPVETQSPQIRVYTLDSSMTIGD